MNLIQDHWIPIRRKSGVEERIAPWEITDRHADDPIVRLASPRPDFNGALIQFLIGLLQTTFAPRGVFDWKGKLATPPTQEELRTAFFSVAMAFELDGDGPRFMQDLTLEQGLSETDKEGLSNGPCPETGGTHDTHETARSLMRMDTWLSSSSPRAARSILS